jgi:hypothetical protein
MAKKYFCSYCGTPIIVTRRALPNRGVIVELVEPHDCDERNIHNITDDEKPSPRIRDLTQPAPSEEKDSLGFPVPDFGDKRDKSVIKSTAPTNVLSKVKGGQNTNPEHDLEE